MGTFKITSDLIGVGQVRGAHIEQRAITTDHIRPGAVQNLSIASASIDVRHLSNDLALRLLPAPTPQGSNWQDAMLYTPSQPGRDNPFVTLNDVRIRSNRWLQPVDTITERSDPAGSVRLELSSGRVFYVPRARAGQEQPQYEPVRFSHANAADLEALPGHRHVTTEQLETISSLADLHARNQADRAGVIRRYTTRDTLQSVRLRQKTSATAAGGAITVGGALGDATGRVRIVSGWYSSTVSPDEEHETPFTLKYTAREGIPMAHGQARGTHTPTSIAGDADRVFYGEGVSLYHGVLTLTDNAFFNELDPSNDGGYRPGSVMVRGMHGVSSDEDDPFVVTGIETTNEDTPTLALRVQSPNTADRMDHDPVDVTLNAATQDDAGIHLRPIVNWRDVAALDVPARPKKIKVLADSDGACWLFALINGSPFLWIFERDSGRYARVALSTDATGDDFNIVTWRELDAIIVDVDSPEMEYGPTQHLVFAGVDSLGEARLYWSYPLQRGVGDAQAFAGVQLQEATGTLRSRFYTAASRPLDRARDLRLVRSSRQRWAGTPQCGIVFKQRNMLFFGFTWFTLASDSSQVVDVAIKRANGPERAWGRYAVDGCDDNGFVIAVELIPQRSVSIAVVRWTAPGVQDYWQSVDVAARAEGALNDMRVAVVQPYRRSTDGAAIGSAQNRFVHLLLLNESGTLRDVVFQLTSTHSAELSEGLVTNEFVRLDERVVTCGVSTIDDVMGGPQGWMAYTTNGGVQRWTYTSPVGRQISADTQSIAGADADAWCAPKSTPTGARIVTASAAPYHMYGGPPQHATSDPIVRPLAAGEPLAPWAAGVRSADERGAWDIVVYSCEGQGGLTPLTRYLAPTSSSVRHPGWFGPAALALVQPSDGVINIVLAGGGSSDGDSVNATTALTKAQVGAIDGLDARVTELVFSKISDMNSADATLRVGCAYASAAVIAHDGNSWDAYVYGGLLTGRPYSLDSQRNDWLQRIFFYRDGDDLRVYMCQEVQLGSVVTGGYGAVVFVHNTNGQWVLYNVTPNGEVFIAPLDTNVSYDDSLGAYLPTSTQTTPTGSDFVEISTVNATSRNTNPGAYLAGVACAQWATSPMRVVRYPHATSTVLPVMTWVVYVEAGVDMAESEVKVLEVNTSNSASSVPLPNQLTWHSALRTSDSSSPTARTQAHLAFLGSLSQDNVRLFDPNAIDCGAVFLMQGGVLVDGQDTTDETWVLELWRTQTQIDQPVTFAHRWTRVDASIGSTGPGPLAGGSTLSIPNALDSGLTGVSVPRVLIAGGSPGGVSQQLHPEFMTMYEWPESYNTASVIMRHALRAGCGPYVTDCASLVLLGPIDARYWTRFLLELSTALPNSVPAGTTLRFMVSTNPITDSWSRYVAGSGWENFEAGSQLRVSDVFEYGTDVPAVALDGSNEYELLARGDSSWDIQENQLWIALAFDTSHPAVTPLLAQFALQLYVNNGDVLYNAPGAGTAAAPRSLVTARWALDDATNRTAEHVTATIERD